MTEADEWQPMDLRPAREERRSGGGVWALFLFIAGYLVVLCLWRLFVTAHSCGAPSSEKMAMAFEVLMLLSLIGLRRRAVGDDEARQRVGGRVLFFGTAAGLGLIAMRLLEPIQWCSGHLTYAFRP